MVTTTSWITKTPDVCGGDACIRNTRITVWGLVEWQRLGVSDEDILRRVQGLTAADLETAWDYYRKNGPEVEQALWEEQACMVEHDGHNVPVWLLVQGRRLGLSDERIRNAFEPPLSQAVLEAAWGEGKLKPQ
jgi:uncharacterized protein (DUF433 family)